MPRARKVLSVAGLLAALAGPAGAATLNVDYGISLGGFPIGSADLDGTFEGTQYKLQIQARLTGLAGAITGGRGGATAAGSVAGGRPLPASFAVTSRSSEEQRTVRMGLASGNVVAIDIAPPIDDRSDRVPVTEPHKRGVVDPVSALVMPARGEPTDAANCNRTIPVFDGAARFDMVLSYADTRRVEKPGYSGPVLVCNVRYVPIAGHRPNRQATKFMQDNRDISVWLAPVEGSRVLVPLRIAVRTMVGMSVIEASRWTLGDAKASRAAGQAARN